MATLSSDITDATLLCERCGYVLEGLDERGACPECGQPIAESLPSRRTGTPWQHRRSVTAWWRTLVLVIRHPIRAAAMMHIERTGMQRLTWLNVLLAGVLLALGWGKSLWEVQIRFGTELNGWWEVVLAALTVMAMFLVPLFSLTLFALTWIEMRGVRFFGGRRGWRISPAVAWAVCGHMSFWWVLGAAITLVVALFLPGSEPVWQLTRWLWNQNIPALDVRMLIGAGVFFLAGLMPFECAVFLGVRRCRFANTRSKDTPQSA